MFYLSKLRDYPERMRSISVDGFNNYSTGEVKYFWPGGGLTIPGVPGERSRDASVIYDDEPTPARQNNCVHWKRSYMIPAVSANSPNCVQPGVYVEYKNANISHLERSVLDGLAPYPVDEFMSQRVVQDAIAGVYTKQSNKLYRLTSKELPDLTVFLVEAHELGQMFSIVKGMMMHGVTLKKALKTLERRLKRLKRMRKTVVVKRYIRDCIKAIQAVSADIVKWRFGVLSPIRDIVKIATSISIYMDEINSFQDLQTVRSSEEFEFMVWWGDAASEGCSGSDCRSLYENPRYCTRSTIKGRVTYAMKVKNPFRGGPIEKTILALLGQCSMLPSVDTLWELTRLSWLVDYFLRTSVLLSKLERLLGLGPKDVIVEESSISLSFTEKQETFNPCWRIGQGFKPSIVTEHDWYERIVSDGDINFVEVVPLWKWPKGAEKTTALAYTLMRLLIRVRFKCD